MWLCLRRRFLPLGLHKRIWNSPCLLILLIHTKHKTIRSNLGDPRLHSLEGEFIYWVDKAKNVWLTVGQLPIKAGWWDAPPALQHFRHKHKILITGVTQENLQLPPYLLILLIHAKHKTIRWYLGLTPRLHFLEAELTNWVDRVKACD